MIIIDTSGLISALFSDQRHHEACAEALRTATPARIITPFVLAEADYLIRKYGGVGAELELLAEITRRAYLVELFDNKDVTEAAKLVQKYKSCGIGLADASVALLAARYNAPILTLDERHFRTIRVDGKKPLRILPTDA